MSQWISMFSNIMTTAGYLFGGPFVPTAAVRTAKEVTNIDLFVKEISTLEMSVSKRAVSKSTRSPTGTAGLIKSSKDVAPKSDAKNPSADETMQKICGYCKTQLSSCTRSQVDHNQEISRDIWAVSMVIIKGRTKLRDLLNHHTVLIIEGLKPNGKFWQRAELTAPLSCYDSRAIRDCFSGHSNTGLVLLTDEKYYPLDLTKFKKYRQTWTRSRDKIETLLAEIRWDQAHPEATPFRFLGERSLVATTRTFVDTRDPELIQFEARFPGKVKLLSKCVLEIDKFMKFFEQSSVDPSYNLKLLAFLIIYFGEDVRLSPYINQVLKNLMKVQKTGCDLMFPMLLSIFAMEFNFFVSRAKISEVISRNCFNYGRKKLGTLDIQLDVKPFEILLAVPESYLPNAEVNLNSTSQDNSQNLANDKKSK